MEDTISKIHLDWNDIDNLIGVIVEKVYTEYPNIDSVHGIARGGLIPAVLISHKLGLPYVNAVGPNTLVVDDICDSGYTLDTGPGVYTAVLHYKPHTSCFIPQLWAKLHEGDEWVIYPWETKDSESIQDYLKSDEFNEGSRENHLQKLTDQAQDLDLGYDKELDHLKDGHYIAGMTNDKEGSFMKFQNKIKTKNK